MPWWLPWFTPRSETIKLKSCQNLIQHYLGDFLEHQVTIDQLSVNIFKGTGKVCDIKLNCEALNELGEQQNWPIKIVESYVKDVTIRIPWKDLLQNDSIFKINGLSLTVQPKVRTEPVTSILKWVLLNWSKLITHKYVFTSNNKEDRNQEPGTGQAAKLFAESYNTILRRLKVKLVNTRIRFEHVPKDIDRGFALEFNIKNIDYWDESFSDLVTVRTDPEGCTRYAPNSCIHKKVKFEGVTLFMHLFDDPAARASNVCQDFGNDCSEDMLKPDKRVPDMTGKQDINILNDPNDINEISATHVCEKSGEIIPVDKLKQVEPVLFTSLNEQQGLMLTFTDAEKSIVPKVKIQTMGPFVIVLSPKDIDSVIKIIKLVQDS